MPHLVLQQFLKKILILVMKDAAHIQKYQESNTICLVSGWKIIFVLNLKQNHEKTPDKIPKYFTLKGAIKK